MASGVILGSHQVHLYRSIAGAAPPDALNIVFGGPQIILWKPDANVETGKPLWKPLWKLLGKCWKPWNPYYILKENTHTLSLFKYTKYGFQHFSNSFHNGFHNGFQKFGGFHDSSHAQTECTPPSCTFSTSGETSRD